MAEVDEAGQLFGRTRTCGEALAVLAKSVFIAVVIAAIVISLTVFTVAQVFIELENHPELVQNMNGACQ